MNNSRKIKVSVFASALALLMLIGLTLAFLTDMRFVNNVLGFGSGGGNPGDKATVQISLTEVEFAKQTGNASYIGTGNTEIVGATLEDIQPGDSISKDPNVANVGKDDIFIRVKLDITDTQLTKLALAGLTINPAFEKNADGYYYYGAAGQSTLLPTSASVDFFQVTGANRVSMVIPTSWTSADFEALGLVDGSMDMDITAEAIQASNFDGAYPWMDGGAPVQASAIVSESNR